MDLSLVTMHSMVKVGCIDLGIGGVKVRMAKELLRGKGNGHRKLHRLFFGKGPEPSAMLLIHDTVNRTERTKVSREVHDLITISI